MVNMKSRIKRKHLADSEALNGPRHGRPTEPSFGTKERLEIDIRRYSLVYAFVRDRVNEGCTQDEAYERATKQLRKRVVGGVPRKFPFDTVKKHHIRMRRSMLAAKAAGINVDFLERPSLTYTEADV